MMPTLNICNLEGFWAQGWRKYVILRVSVWGMCIFYWIYVANIWEYMSFGGFPGGLQAQGWEMYIFLHFFY